MLLRVGVLSLIFLAQIACGDDLSRSTLADAGSKEEVVLPDPPIEPIGNCTVMGVNQDLLGRRTIFWELEVDERGHIVGGRTEHVYLRSIFNEWDTGQLLRRPVLIEVDYDELDRVTRVEHRRESDDALFDREILIYGADDLVEEHRYETGIAHDERRFPISYFEQRWVEDGVVLIREHRARGDFGFSSETAIEEGIVVERTDTNLDGTIDQITERSRIGAQFVETTTDAEGAFIHRVRANINNAGALLSLAIDRNGDGFAEIDVGFFTDADVRSAEIISYSAGSVDQIYSTSTVSETIDGATRILRGSEISGFDGDENWEMRIETFAGLYRSEILRIPSSLLAVRNYEVMGDCGTRVPLLARPAFRHHHPWGFTIPSALGFLSVSLSEPAAVLRFLP